MHGPARPRYDMSCESPGRCPPAGRTQSDSLRLREPWSLVDRQDGRTAPELIVLSLHSLTLAQAGDFLFDDYSSSP